MHTYYKESNWCFESQEVGHFVLERSLARADMLVHRVHSCTIHSIRERAFLILGELRHRTAAGKPTAGCRTLYTGKTHTEHGLYRLRESCWLPFGYNLFEDTENRLKIVPWNLEITTECDKCYSKPLNKNIQTDYCEESFIKNVNIVTSQKYTRNDLQK